MKRHLLLGRKTMTNLASILKSRHMTANKVHIVRANGFPSSYVQMWELDYKQGWALKLMLSNCGAGEDSWKSLGQQGDRSVLREISPEYSLEGLMWAEAPILWPPDGKSWHWKRPCCWESLWAGGEVSTEDEMVGWHHRFNGHEFEQTVSWRWTGKPGVLESIRLQSQTRLSDWTNLFSGLVFIIKYVILGFWKKLGNLFKDIQLLIIFIHSYFIQEHTYVSLWLNVSTDVYTV